MFEVISKNRATGEEKVIRSGMSEAKAHSLAVRCSLAESNRHVIYFVR